MRIHYYILRVYHMILQSDKSLSNRLIIIQDSCKILVQGLPNNLKNA